MITLLVLVSSVIAIAVCQDARLIVMGPTYIRPRQPYTVALANLFDSNAAVKLTLKCDDESEFQRNVRLVIRGQSIKSHSFAVPEISQSRCTFSAIDVGGRIPVNHNVELMFPTKTLSIFVLTDKPVYKLGDEIRLRVVVVDITTRPVKHINSVKIYLEDSDGYSRRRWTQAKLHTGMFEAAYQLPSSATVGTWTISVTAHDGSIENRKSQQFEVRESIMQELVVNVIPSRTLLISDKEISLHIALHHASGMPVRGKLRVDLFANKTSTEPSHRNFGNFHSSASITFKLKSQLHLPEGDDHVMVKTFVSLTEEISNVTSSFTKEIPVFLYPYKVSLIKPQPNYQPQSDYYCKLLITDHDGIPVKSEGMNATIKTGSDDVTAEMNNQGTAFVVLPMPNEVKNVTISVYFENLEYKNIEVINGLQQTTTQHLNIYPMDRIIAGESVTFTVSSNKDFTNLYIFTEMRGSVQSMGCWKFNGKRSHKFGFRLTDDMAPFSRLLVFTINNNQIIMGSLELDFEYFENEFEHRLDRATYHSNQSLHIEVTAASDSLVAFQAIHQGTLPLGCHEFGLTRTQVLEDLEEYVGGRNSNNHDIINSFGLFLKTGEISLNLVPPTFPKRSRDKILCVDKESILVNNNISETWLWTSISMDDQSTKTIAEVVPDTVISWYMTGFALSPTLGLGLMDAPQKFTVVKPFYITTHLPYSVKLNEIVRIEVTLYNFLDTPLATEVTLFNQNNEFECVDRAPTNSNHHSKDVVVSVNKETTVYFLVKTKKLGDIAIKIEATNQAAYDRVENILSVIQESRLYSFQDIGVFDFNSHGTKTFDMMLGKSRGVDPDITTVNYAIHNLFTPLDLGMISEMYDIPVRSHSGIPLAFIPNVAVLNYVMETKLSTPYNLRTSIYNDYKELLKYRHSSGAFSQWIPPNGKPSIYLTALVANSLGIASKYMDVDEMVIKRAFSWISKKQSSDGCFVEDGEMIASHVNNDLTPYTLTAFIVAAVKENGDIAGQFNTLVETAAGCLKWIKYPLSTHEKAIVTYALSLIEYYKADDYVEYLINSAVKHHTGYYWNHVLNVEIAGYAILSLIAVENAFASFAFMKWLNNQQYSIEGFDNVHRTFIALKSLGKVAAYANERKANFTVKTNHSENFEVDNLENPIMKSFDVPEHVRSVEWSFTGIGYCVIEMRHQFRTNIVSTTNRFNLNATVFRSNNYNVQNLQVCLSFIILEDYKQSGVTIVEVHLPSGLVFPNNTVHELNHRIQKTKRALGNTVMFVYYDDVGVDRVCFEVTAHRKFMIANQQPSYVAAFIRDDNEALNSLSTYEGAIMSVCEICDDEDCKTMNC